MFSAISKNRKVLWAKAESWPLENLFWNLLENSQKNTGAKESLLEEKKLALNFVDKKVRHWQNNLSLFTDEFFPVAIWKYLLN